MSIQSHLQDIALAQYTQAIQEHGFETWSDLVRITESDLEQIGMLRGHRRRLQRALDLLPTREDKTDSSIAKALTEYISLYSLEDFSTYDSPARQRPKRRYRRHPKRDQSAPARPKTAYQFFAHDVRQQTQDDGMTFVELAKLVGAKWRVQSRDERNTWTARASTAKTEFQTQSRFYEATPEYRLHQQYLQDFKNPKHSSGPIPPSIAAGSSSVNNPSESAKDVTGPYSFGSQTTQPPREQGAAIATEGHGHGHAPAPVADCSQCWETTHSLAGSLRSEGSTTNGTISHERDRPSISAIATRSEESQYFRTVLHGSAPASAPASAPLGEHR